MTEVYGSRDQRIMSRFERRRRRQWVIRIVESLATMLAPIPVFLCFSGRMTDAQIISWGPYIGVAVCGLIAAHLRNWRCPACLGPLGNLERTRFCQSCGVRLR